jgi:N-acyl homoserine lactone hydrolase
VSTYSIWVMEYAHVPNFHRSILTYGAHNQGTRRAPYGYIVIKGKEGIALVDVGFNNAEYGKVLAASYNVQGWYPPHEVLSELSIAPEDIANIFLTHTHFDHMGNMDAFPNATFYIQEQELAKWVWTLSLDRRYRWLMGGIDPADILKCVERARDKRLVCVDGDRENVLPGIDLFAAPDTHTWGSMYVRVRNDSAPNSQDNWVFAGDLVYTYENLRGFLPEDPEYIPIGLATGSQFKLIQTMDAMIKHAGGDLRRVIPVHEDALKKVFPSRITSRGLCVTELALANGETSRVK